MRIVLVVAAVLFAFAGMTLAEDVQSPSCRAALLVIDVQRAWLGSLAVTTDHVPVQERAAQLTEAARASGVPVVFVIDVGHRDRFTDDELRLAPPLRILEGDLVVEKSFQNGFVMTPLREKLLKMGITTVLITGYASHECVAATVDGALRAGFDVVIVADGHSGGLAGYRAAEQNRNWEERGLRVVRSGELDFESLCSPPVEACGE